MKKILKAISASAVIVGMLIVGNVYAMADGSNYAFTANGNVPEAGDTLANNSYGTVTAYAIPGSDATQFKSQKATTVGKHTYSKAGFSTNQINTTLTVDNANASYRIAFEFTALKDTILRVDAKVNNGKQISVLTDLDTDAATANSLYSYNNTTGSNVLNTFAFYIPKDSTVWFAGVGTDIPIYGIDICNTAETMEKLGNDFYAVTDKSSNSTYIIHTVTSSELAANSLSLKGKSGNVAETETVYPSIEFLDGSTYNPDEGKYVYAVKVSDTSGIQPSATSFTWVTN